jgi:hypothetical protein
MIIITILLNALCESGMGIISWILVFIPFIFMSVIIAILLYVFGLDPATGKLNIQCDNYDSSVSKKSGNLIYSSTIKTPNKKVNVNHLDTNTNELSLFRVSDPQYE